MALAPRRLRAIAGMTMAFVAASAIAVTAIQADGRPASESETNDGGAWLLDRQASAIGHVDRASREVSGAVRVAEPGSVFWVDQSAETVLVHNESTQSVSVVDGRTYAVTGTVPLALDVTLDAIDDGAVLTSPEPLRMWRLPVAELTAMDAELGDLAPTVSSTAPGLSTTTPDDLTITVDGDGVAHWFSDDGSDVQQVLPLDDDLVALTALGDDAVVVTEDSLVTVNPFGAPTRAQLGALPDEVVWQRPGAAAPTVVGMGAGGEVIAVDRSTGQVTDLFRLDGTEPAPPIVHQGCTFALVRTPATFARQCGTGSDALLEVPLPEVSTGVLEMRLVNGWVWINAVDTGRAWVIDESSGLDEVDDIGDSLADDEDSQEQEVTESDSSIQQQDNDAASLGRADLLDDDGQNEPPVAEPDEVSGRAGQPVLVQVLRNDLDPDGDVMLVTRTRTGDGDARVEPTADRSFVQVTPQPGFTGTVTFEYTIEDGRGGADSTTSTVEFRSDDPGDNRAPVPETDVMAAAPSRPASVNVLDNDLDPDGDSLQLISIEGEDGEITSSPDGEVTFTADQATSGEVELEYVVADGYGAEATGLVRVNVRTVDEANRPPDARNDSGSTAVDKPIVMNVLDNDLDADGDRITVTGPALAVVVPAGADDVFVSLSPDGVFFIEPEVVGDYVFRYQISDGASNDIAQIRVRVTDPEANRPPVAVRDDAVIPLGATRVVQALRNDGDPDGDVLGIVGWGGSSGLVVERITGIGFRVTTLASAAPVERFTYEVSDGVNDPVFGTVVVTVSQASGEDQRPVAKPDVVEVQPGQSIAVPVLRNDFDPEGGSLAVVGVTERQDARIAVGGGGQSVIVGLAEDARLGFTFGYEIADEAGNRASTTVEVQVVQPGDQNRAPLAVPDVATTLERTPVVIEVLANDSDPDGDTLQVESIATQPDNGVARTLDDGTVEYTPAAGTTGTDRFEYSLVDARGARVVGKVLVGVMPVPDENRPPLAIADQVEVGAGAGPVVVDVLANDVDPDDDRLVVTDTSDVGRGTVRVNDAGTLVVYTPPDELDQDQERDQVAFRYSIDDGAGHTVDGVVEVTLLAVVEPIPPVANDDRAGPVTAGDVVVVPVLDNDLDPDGDPAELAVSSDDASVQVRPNGALAITPDDQTRQYVYTVTDADELSASASVTVVVVDNRAPEVESSERDTPFETAVEFDLTGQATDPDGDALRYRCCDQVRGGSAEVLSGDASSLRVRFTPNPGFAGEGGLAFTVDDQHGHQVAATAIVVVQPAANTPPAVEDRAVEAEVGRITTVDIADLVTDDDPDDDHRLEVGTARGPFSLQRSGERVLVDPEITATGERGSFTVTATDQAGQSATGTVTLSLVPSTLPPPTATNDRASTTQASSVTIPVLRNDIGDGLELLDATSTNGSATVRGDLVDFNPDPDFFGTAIVTYTIGDRQQTQARQATGQVRVDVIGFPGQPAAPQVTADSREATLTWTAPAANGAAIDGYELQHDHDGFEPLETPTTFQWTGLSNGTVYTFRLRATNAAGPGEWSEWSTPVTPNAIPGRPAAPRVTFGNRELDVQWDRPANDGTAITDYELEIGGSASDSREIKPGGATTTYPWEELDNGAEYQFRVRAINAAGNSPWSTWSPTEHPLTTPAAPGTPVIGTGPTHLDVDWNRPDDGGDTIQRYQVQRRHQGNNQTIVAATVFGANTTRYPWGELPSGTFFEFRVRAVNRATPTSTGWSGWSEPARACAQPPTPGAPTATRGDREVGVSIAIPSRSCPITDVEFQHDRADDTYNHSDGAGPISPLTNGTAYRFRARFVNEQRTGIWGAWSTAVTPAGPAGPPTSMTTAARTGVSGSMLLTWNAGDPNGSAITSYRVFVDGSQVANLGGSARSHTVDGLTPGRTYTFAVTATNGVGSSGSISRLNTARGAPSSIGSLTVSNSTRGRLVWNWNQPAGNGGGVDHYLVDRNANNVNTMRTTSRSHTWSDLNDSTTKVVRVRACNEFGCGGWSPTRSGTTQPTPPPPRQAIASRGNVAPPDPDCPNGPCYQVRLELRGFAPNTTYDMICQFRNSTTQQITYSGGPWSYMENGSILRTNGAGNTSPTDSQCFMAGTNRDTRIIVVADQTSNVVGQTPWVTW